MELRTTAYVLLMFNRRHGIILIFDARLFCGPFMHQFLLSLAVLLLLLLGAQLALSRTLPAV